MVLSKQCTGNLYTILCVIVKLMHKLFAVITYDSCESFFFITNVQDTNEKPPNKTKKSCNNNKTCKKLRYQIRCFEIRCVYLVRVSSHLRSFYKIIFIILIVFIFLCRKDLVAWNRYVATITFFPSPLNVKISLLLLCSKHLRDVA